MVKTSAKDFKDLGKRLTVAVVWLAVCLLVLLKLPVWATAVLETIAAFFMAKELMHNTGFVKNKFLVVVGILQAIIIPWMIYFNAGTQAYITSLFVFVFLVFFVEMISVNKGGIFSACVTVFSAFVFPAFISLLVPILELNNGRILVLIPFISAWCSDAAAYFIGSVFGKHKLAPSISPNKSVEGMAGGVFGGISGMLVYGLILTVTGFDVPWILFAVMGLLGSLFGLCGDLFLSQIKRESNIKDFGNFLPGHGGVLDRFDSTLFVVPICFFIFKFLN